MKADYKTDTGKQRKHNEDSLIVDAKRDIFIVADGMGGHRAGEMASRIAVEVVYDYLLASADQTSGGKDIHELLRTALFKAHDAIMASTINNLPLKGMGTTLVIMIIRGNRAYICHVGDSRAYLIRREDIRMVTKDQTVGEYVVRHKKMRTEEVPRKFWHTLTQAVGVTKKIVPESKDFELRTGDILLLCSDGLSDMLSDKELLGIIKKNRGKNFDDTARMLVETANKKGGSDNISVVLVEYKRVKAETERTSFSFN